LGVLSLDLFLLLDVCNDIRAVEEGIIAPLL
jgi:hypothetical protein